jgi:hypothetical protein
MDVRAVGSIVLEDGLRVVTTNAEVNRENGRHMPIFYSPQSGTCANCGQHWTVSFPAFDVYCPQCHTLVMRIGPFNRISGALLIGGALLVFGGLMVLALRAVAGTAGLVVGVVIAVTASVSGAVWTYRAVRLHRTVARPVRDYARGLVRP